MSGRVGPAAPGSRVRIVAWNIRAGGGTRVEAIARQIERWVPDVAALCEFRATPPSRELARRLAQRGLPHQRTTADRREPGVNRLLVASRWPLRRIRLPGEPTEPGRWLLAAVAAPRPFLLGAMHVPNRVTGRKYPFLDAVLGLAGRWRGGPAVFVGDTNSGRRGIDEERPGFNAHEDGFMVGLEQYGWADAFRRVRGGARAFTWYSPNAGNGFRIDQAFVNPHLLPELRDARYAWGRTRARAGRAAVSDHAALLLDLGGGTAAPRSPSEEPGEGDEKGPAARRRPKVARAAYSLYVERAAEGANEADGPVSSS